MGDITFLSTSDISLKHNGAMSYQHGSYLQLCVGGYNEFADNFAQKSLLITFSSVDSLTILSSKTQARYFAETSVRRRSTNSVFLKVFQNSQENNRARISFFGKDAD